MFSKIAIILLVTANVHFGANRVTIDVKHFDKETLCDGVINFQGHQNSILILNLENNITEDYKSAFTKWLNELVEKTILHGKLSELHIQARDPENPGLGKFLISEDMRGYIRAITDALFLDGTKFF